MDRDLGVSELVQEVDSYDSGLTDNGSPEYSDNTFLMSDSGVVLEMTVSKGRVHRKKPRRES